MTQFQSEKGERRKFEKHDVEEVKKIIEDKPTVCNVIKNKV